MEEKLHEDGALRAPYETYRESEVFGLNAVANLSLREMLALHKRMNHTDILMLGWISTIAGIRRWEAFMRKEDLKEEDLEGLFELIMTLEGMYGDYIAQEQNPLSRTDFAFAVAEFLDDGWTLDGLGETPDELYDHLAWEGGE